MGFRGLPLTESMHRDKPWPSWFTDKWKDLMEFRDGSTLCVPRTEFKTARDFAHDYGNALKEIGWNFSEFDAYGGKRQHCAAVSVLWDCGATQTFHIWPDGDDTDDYSESHGDGCDHAWRTVYPERVST